MPYLSDNIVPRRIFLDTNTFQAIADCGGYVFGEDSLSEIEDDNLDRLPQVLQRPDGHAVLNSLRWIFTFNDRAQFDWILAPSSLDEIDAAKNSWRSKYARDIMGHSNICLAENPPTHDAGAIVDPIKGHNLGNVSEKDRKLIMYAAAAECDHFLTIEKRLPKQSQTILKFIPLYICTPCELWRKLEPHMRGL